MKTPALPLFALALLSPPAAAAPSQLVELEVLVIQACGDSALALDAGTLALDALRSEAGLRVLYAPRIVTFNGRTASASVSEASGDHMQLQLEPLILGQQLLLDGSFWLRQGEHSSHSSFTTLASPGSTVPLARLQATACGRREQGVVLVAVTPQAMERTDATETPGRRTEGSLGETHKGRRHEGSRATRLQRRGYLASSATRGSARRTCTGVALPLHRKFCRRATRASSIVLTGAGTTRQRGLFRLGRRQRQEEIDLTDGVRMPSPRHGFRKTHAW